MVRTHTRDCNDARQRQGIIIVLGVPDRIDTRRAPPLHPLCAALPSLRRPPRTCGPPALPSQPASLAEVDLSFVCGSCGRGRGCHGGGIWFKCCGADEGGRGCAETPECCSGAAGVGQYVVE